MAKPKLQTGSVLDGFTVGELVYKGGIDSIPSYRADSLPKAVNYVRETLAALAANRPVPNPSTRAYGCTIHYGS